MGLGFFLNSSIAEAPLKQTGLPGCACCSLSVLNCARGTTWTLSLCQVLEELLGAQRAGSFLAKKKWRKKNHCELFETIYPENHGKPGPGSNKSSYFSELFLLFCMIHLG